MRTEVTLVPRLSRGHQKQTFLRTRARNAGTFRTHTSLLVRCPMLRRSGGPPGKCGNERAPGPSIARYVPSTSRSADRAGRGPRGPRLAPDNWSGDLAFGLRFGFPWYRQYVKIQKNPDYAPRRAILKLKDKISDSNSESAFCLRSSPVRLYFIRLMLHRTEGLRGSGLRGIRL